MRIYARVCQRLRAFAYAYAYTHICEYAYMYLYVCVFVCVCLFVLFAMMEYEWQSILRHVIVFLDLRIQIKTR